MSNIKKGDSVRCTHPCLRGPQKGDIVTVLDIDIDGSFLKPSGYSDRWLIGNFEKVNEAPFQLGDEVMWNKDEPRNSLSNRPENLSKTGKVTKVWHKSDGHVSNRGWYINVEDRFGYTGSHYAYRFKLINPKENSTVKQYTQEEIVTAIIGYKSSATPAVRAKLIQTITTRISNRYGSLDSMAKVPNDLIIAAINSLVGVCDEGKTKFIKHLQLIEEFKKPEKLYITICVEPGSAFDASSSYDDVRNAYHRVHELLNETGLGKATWSSAQVGKPDDMVSTWSEIYDRGAGKSK